MSRRVASLVGALLLAVALPLVSPVDARAATTATSYEFNPNPIAATGTLSSGQTVSVTLKAKDANGADISDAAVDLYFIGTGSATSSACTPNTLPSSATNPAVCATSGGLLTIIFTAGSAVSGLGTIWAEGSPNGGPTAWASYDYTKPVYSFGGSPGPIAPPGSLTSDAYTQITITVVDTAAGEARNALAMADQVYLSFDGSNGQPAKGSAVAYDPGFFTTGQCSTAPSMDPATNRIKPQRSVLTSTAQPIDVSADEKVIVCYKTPSGSPPPTGTDVLTVQKDAGGTPRASISYSYANAAVDYRLSPNPIAPPATLGPRQPVPVTVRPLDPSGAPIAGLGGVYLVANGSSGATVSASQCPAGATTAITSTPVSCTSDANGSIGLTYVTGATVPTSGADTITAADAAASPTKSTSTGYSYGAAQTADYTYEPSPIAPGGSLAASGTAPVKLTARDATGAPVPFTKVFLWLKRAGSAAAATAAGCGSLPTAPADAIACPTDAAGTINLTYTAPAAPMPTTGEDAIEAQNEKGATPAVGPISDDYTFTPVNAYAFSQSPIAPTSSLGGNQTVNVTLTALNGASTPAAVPSAVVYLALTGLDKNANAAGSASAQCGTTATALSTTPVACTADSSGRIAIAYKTPSVLPSGGTDAIRAMSQVPSDGYSNPAVTNTDTYAFNPLGSYTFSPSPIAAPGSIAPGGSVPVTVTATKAAASGGTAVAGAKVYLSLTPATGVGSASVTQCGAVTSLSATPVVCTADSSGKVSITYKAPSPGTTAGTATIKAHDAPTEAASSVKASDQYVLLAKFGFQRLAGADRYETAAAIARAAFPNGSATAVLTTGANFPDALAGAFLAGTEAGGAPIVLTDPEALPDATKAVLRDLRVGKVLILGGTAAVSDGVVSALTAAGHTTTRIAGDTRYDTMKLLVDQRTASVGVVDGKRTAILATGENFPDALGAGPLSYGKRLPLVLTNGRRSSLLPQARDALTSARIAQVIIVGGTGAINPGINSELKTMGITVIEQAAGQNRSETSTLLATWAVGHKLASANAIGVANGCRPEAGAGVVPCFTPDALSGAPFGGSQSPSPIPTLITSLPTDAGDVTEYARTNKSTLQVGHVYGGTSAVAESTLKTITAAIGA